MSRTRPFIIALIFAAVLLPVTRALAVTGAITGYTVWDTSGSPYTVTGDIQVDTGDTLVIEAGVTVVFTANSDDQVYGNNSSLSEIYVTNGGQLYIEGAVDDSVVLTGSNGSSAGEWFGISVNGTGAVRVSHCVMEYPSYGLYFSSVTTDTIMLTDSRLSNVSTGIYCSQYSGSEWLIDGNLIRDFSSYGMYLRYPSNTVISNNTIISNGATGIYLRYNTGGNDSTCTVSGNTISGNGNGYGIWCRDQRVTVTGNVIDNFYYGINYDWNVNKAVVMPVSGNTVTNGAYGVYLTNYSTPPITGNSIYGQSMYQLHSQVVDSTITATGNWWGSATTVEMEAGANPKNISTLYDGYDNDNYGFIDYSGWLDAEGGSPAPTSASGAISLTDNAQTVRVGYGLGDTAWVRVDDADRNADTLTSESVTVYLVSGTETVPEALVLSETGVSTGVFFGYMVLDSSGTMAADGELQVVKSDLVTVTYHEDANRYDDPDTLTHAVRYGVALVSGELTGRTVWTKAASPYLVTGDVLLYAGDTLVVEPGATVLFAARQDDQADGGDSRLAEIYAYTDAFVYAVGAVDDSIRFTSSAAVPAAGDWYGIHLYGSAAARIRYCAIDYATYSVIGINNTTDTIRVSNCRITDTYNGVNLTQSYPGVAWEIDSNYIADAGQYGVYANYAGFVTVSNNTINAPNGISIQYAQGSNDSGTVITGNTITGSGSGSGIYCYATRPLIQNNTVSAYSYGVNINLYQDKPNPVTIAGNDIDGCGSSVYLYQYVDANINDNAFVGYSNYAVHCQSYRDVDARNNYWGSALTAEMEEGGNPRDLDDIFDSYESGSWGTVDYSGWLNAPGGIAATGNYGGQVMIADGSGSIPVYFSAADSIYLTVSDPDMDADTGVVDSVTVLLTSTTETVPETLTLPETGPATGLFRLAMDIDASAAAVQDGRIQAVDGDILRLTYYDAAGIYGLSDTVYGEGLYAPLEVSGAVTGDVVWNAADGPYVITGDIIVTGSNSLTIRPGTEIRFMPGQDDQATGRSSTQAEFYVHSGGRLVFAGTADSMITLTSAAGVPATGDWGDVYVNGTGILRMAYCDVRYAQYGVYSNVTDVDSVVVGNSRFTGTQNALYLDNNTDGCVFLFDGNHVSHTTSYGVYAYYGRDLTVSNCTFDTTGNYAVYTYLYYDSDILITNCTFNGDGTGSNRAVYALYSRPDITDNVFNNYYYGIYCNLSNIGFGTGQDISGNTFTDGEYGIYINGGSIPDIHRNSFGGQSSYHVYNAGSNDIDARNNWWGTATVAEMDGATYPADIAGLYDKEDNAGTGRLHYFGWLDAENGSPVDSAYDGDMAMVDALGGDKDFYTAGDSVRIRVTDIDLNTDPGVRDTVLVLLSSPSETAAETLAVVETGTDTDEFMGVMPLAASASGTVDGIVQVAVDGMVTATYAEARNQYGLAVSHTDDARFGMNPVSGGISGRTEWTAAGGPYLVTGDILVEDGDTLVITPGTKVYFSALADDQAAGRTTTLSEIVVDGGYLYAAGTADSTIIFTSYAASPAEGDWSGIVFETTGDGFISCCRFEYALYPVFSRAGVSGDVVIERSHVFDAYTALYVDNGGAGRTITADSLHLHAPSSVGIYLNSTYNDVAITNGTIDSCLNSGIFANGSQLSDNVVIDGNLIRGTGSYMGIYCNVGRPAITGNDIRGCSDGIRCYNSSTGMPTAQDISGNTITGGANGISLSYYVSPTIQYNNFIGQSSYAVYQSGYKDIDARYNYWDETSTAEMEAGSNPKDISGIFDNYDNAGYGTVRYYAWLDTADGTPSAITATGTVALLDSTGAVNQCYQPGETLFVSITDVDANTDNSTAETLMVYVASTTETVPETLAAVETDTASGVFIAFVVVDSNGTMASDGALQAVYADGITVTYYDTLSGFGDTDTATGFAAFGATRFSGNISGTVTWTKSGNPYVITGDVIITSGNKLVLGPGAVLNFEPQQDDQSTGYNTTLCDIYVYNGELEAVGTVDDSIRFRSGGAVPAAADWGTVYLNGSTSRAELAYCRMDHATQGIYGYNNDSGSGVVRNCAVRNTSSYGIYLNSPDSHWSIDSCAFSDNGNNAVYLNSATDVIISGCRITTAGNNGIYVQYPYAGGTVLISDNTVTGTVVAGAGIRLNGMPAELARNTVTGCQYGIFDSYGSTATPDYSFTGNILTGCAYGIYLSSYAHPVITGNTIDGNTVYAAYTNGSNDIDARANWWGAVLTAEMAGGTNPQNISGIYDEYDNGSYGYINYSAWLDTAGGAPTSSTRSGELSFLDGAGAVRIGYAPGDTVYLSLVEPDADTGAVTAETLAVTVYSTSETGGESVILAETGVNTGVFTGILVADTGAVAADGVLQAVFHDTISAVYADAANDFGDADTISSAARFMGTVVSGSIAGSVTWAKDGNPYFVTGDVLVGSGAHLTVTAGTDVLFAAGYDDTESGSDGTMCELRVTAGGYLTVAGAVDDSVRFTSAAAVPDAGDWYGIYFNGASGGDLAYCRMEYAVNGLYVNGTSVDSVVIRNSRITDGTYGLYLSWCNAGAYVRADNCVIRNQSSHGAYLYYQRNTTISNCDIAGVNGNGIYLQYYSGDDSTCVISGNVITGSGSNNGINSYWLRPTITGNTISNWSYGIYIYHNSYRAAPALISNNVITGGSRAVYFTGNAYAELHGNSFAGQSSYGIYTSSPYDVDATGNYWGEATTAEMEAGGNPKNIAGIYDEYENAAYGLVDYSAWLDTTDGTQATTNEPGRPFFTDAAGDTVLFIPAGDSLYAGLIEPDLDANASLVETVTVYISGPAETETFVLTETGVHTGVFTAYVPVDSNGSVAADGVLQAVKNDSIILSYYDVSTVYGGTDTMTVSLLFAPGLYAGSVTADETWTAANSPYILTGDLTVENGVTLTLEAGTEVYVMPHTDDMAGGLNATLTELRVASGGHLAAEGTAAEPVTFTVLGGAPQQGDWTGLYLINNATARLKHCGITYATYGVYINNIQSDSVVFRNCDIGHVNYAVYMSTVNGAQAVFDSCRIHHTSSYGMNLSYARSTVVSGCTFEHTGNHGIWIDYPYDTDSTTFITGNTFTGSGSYAAVYSYRARAVITGNTITDWQYGIYCNNSAGISYTDQDISCNTITGGQYGIYTNSYSRPQVRFNTITGQSAYQFFNNTIYDQDIRNNWWGTATTAAMEAGSYPQDIGGIYDYYDNSGYGTAYYFGWLDSAGGAPVDSAVSGIITLADAGGVPQISFMDGETLYVRVADADLNNDPGTAETAAAYVTSGTETVPETLVLTETDVNSGIFIGVIPAESTAVAVHDGILQAHPDDPLTAVYDDAVNGFGIPVAVADTARFGITPFSGGISGHVTWRREDSPFLVTGDVQIGSGDTLTVEPGVKIYFMALQDGRAAGDNTASCEIYVDGGHLDLRGTAADSIWLRSYAVSPTYNDWYGIMLRNNATAALAYCNNENSYYGLFATNANAGSITVRNSRFAGNYTAVYVSGGTGTGAVVVDNNHIVKTANTSVNLYNVLADVSVSGNVIDTVGGSYAVYVYGYTTEDNVVIDGNVITGRGSNYGVYANRSRPTITNNAISNLQYGIRCYQSSTAYPTAQDISGNTITGGQYGIYLQNYTGPTVQYNNIYGQSSYQLYHTGYYDIDARYNYWGSPATDSMNAGGNPKNIAGIYDHHDNATYGEVVYFAWLDTVDGAPTDSSMSGVISYTDGAGAPQYAYGLGDTVYLQLNDSDADADPLTVDTLTLLLSSTTETVPETVAVMETGVSSGIFTGGIVLDSSATGSTDGLLQVVFGDTIRSTYHDARGGFGGSDTVIAHAAFMATFVSGRLAGDHTWYRSGSPYVVTGDIILNAGDELVIEPGSRVYFAALTDDRSAGSDATRGEFYVDGGYLSAMGTAADSILFTSLADTPAANDWRGVYVNGNGAADLAHVNIRYAGYPLYLNSLDQRVTLTNSSLMHGTNGVYANTVDATGSVLLDSCYIGNMSQDGMYFNNGRNTVVSNNVVDSVNSEGIRFIYPYVDMNTVISGNTVRGRGSYTGIYVERCQPDITGNTIENWQTGIYTYTSSSGSELQQDITDNVITGGAYGIRIGSYGGPVINYNDIYGQSTYQLYNQSTYDIDARYNYWGEATMAEIEAGGNPKNITGIYDRYESSSYGTVNYSSWLDTVDGTASPAGVSATVTMVDAAGDRSYGTWFGDSALVVVEDMDGNADPAIAETLVVRMGSGTENAVETALLYETGVNTGVFRGGLPIARSDTAVNGDGVIQGMSEDDLFAVYVDETDDYGNADTVSVTAMFGVRTVYGNLDGSHYWAAADGPYLITGDVTLTGSGDRLEIEPGTRVLFQADTDVTGSGDNTLLSEIRVLNGARLEAVGTAGARITFTSAAPVPARSDWYAIYVNGTGGIDLAYCDISFADRNIYGYNTTAYSNTVRYCNSTDATYGMYVYQTYNNASWDISGNRFARTSSYGIYARSIAYVTIDSNVVDTAGSYGLYCYYDYGGLDSTNSVTRNVFNGNGTNSGVYCRYVRPYLADNTVSNFATGLMFNLQAGDSSNQTVAFNTVNGCNTAVNLSGYAAPTLQYNNFAGTSTNAVYSTSARDADARYNYWGADRTVLMDTTSHPANQTFIYDGLDNVSYRTVDYTDWLPRFATHAPVVISDTADIATEDVPYSYVLEYYDLDGTDPAVSISNLPGWLSVSGDTVSGTPREGDGDTSFTITATDGEYSDTVTVAVTVVPVNDPPAVTSAAVDTATEDMAFSYVATASDTDNVPVITISGLPGWLTVSGDTVSGTPTEGIGDTVFMVMAADGEYTDTLSVAVAVLPVNDPPAVTSAATALAVENLPFAYIATASDTDNVPVLSFAALPAWLSASGDTVSGTPGHGQADTSFAVIAGDGEYADTLVVAVTVQDSNHTPVITSAAADTATEDVPYQYRATVTDADSNAVTVTITGLPAWLTVSGDTVSGTPGEGIGDTSFIIIAADAYAAETLSVALAVTPVNDAPVVTSPVTGTVYEDQAFTYVASAADPDGTPALQFSAYPAWMSVSGDTIGGTPAEGDGTTGFILIASDGSLGDTVTVLVTVIPVNDPPVITSAAADSATEDVPYVYHVTVSDPEDDSLTVTFANLPVWLTGAGDSLFGTPGEDHDGPSGFTVYVSDGEYSDTLTGTVTVAEVNDPPVITSAAAADTAVEDQAFEYVAAAVDPDDAPVLSFAAYPAWMHVSGDTISGTPGEGDAGSGFTVIASDGMLGDTLAVTMTVLPVNDPPAITSAAVDSATEDMYFVYRVTAVDPENDSLSVVFADLPAWLGSADDSLFGTPGEDHDGPNGFTVYVSDGEYTDTLTGMVIVAEVNDPPAVTSSVVDTAYADTLYRYILSADDPDDSLTRGFLNYPAWLTVAGDTLYGTATGTTGDTSFMVWAYDGETGDTVTVTLTVLSNDSLSVRVPSGSYGSLIPVFANPSGGRVHFALPADHAPAFILDVITHDGRTVYRHRHKGGAFDHTADLRHLPAGTYVVRLRTAHSLEFRKLIIE